MTVAAFAFYLWCAKGGESGDRWPGGSSLPGVVTGVAAGLLILFEMLLWPRKWPRVRAWRIGRTQAWMRAHIWLGLLTVPMVVLHHGLGFEWGGPLTFFLMICFWVVILSGVLGLYLQHVLPSHLLHAVPAESIASQLPHLSRQMVEDAERMLSDASGTGVGAATSPEDRLDEAPSRAVVFGAVRSVGKIRGKVLETQAIATRRIEPEDAAKVVRAFEQTIRPYLLTGKPSGVQLRKKTQAATYFSALRADVRGDAVEVVDRLYEFCDTRRQFDHQSVVHRLLHGWLCFHLPVSMVLTVLLVAHVISAIRYAGVWPI